MDTPSPVNTSVDVHSLIINTLKYSARVRAISDNAIVAETAITRAAAEFDVHAFMESKLVRTSVPTGSDLDAGVNMPRLRETDAFYKMGVRRKNQHGGRVEVSQQYGTRNSNSVFFVPFQQGNTQLTLSFNQPLLNGRGKSYNTSLIVLADLDTRIASDRTAAELQDHLLEVTQTMWRLYLERVTSLQKQRHLERADVILERLVRRRDLDALDSQIARARAAVAMRRTELIRAATNIRNAEAALRALVNSPEMLCQRDAELVTVQPPLNHYVHVSFGDAMVTALHSRPEIDAATQKIEAARVRLNVAQHEIMPVLDLMLETYVSGLRGNYSVGRAWTDQFREGEPSYSAGLIFEIPLHRRAAFAERQRRQLELRQLTSQFQATIESLHAEVEVAVREVETAYREMKGTHHAMTAANIDSQYLQRRWEVLPGDDRAASFLLDAQDRLSAEESGFAQAQVDYTLTLTRLNRATGNLLRHEQIGKLCEHDGCLPSIRFEKRN